MRSHFLQRSSTAIALSQFNVNEAVIVAGEGAAKSLECHSSLLSALPTRLITACLSVLVAVSGMLDAEDYGQLGILMWDIYLDDSDPLVVAPVSDPKPFLMTVCNCCYTRHVSF